MLVTIQTRIGKTSPRTSRYSVDIFSYSAPSGILGSDGKQNTALLGSDGKQKTALLGSDGKQNTA